MKTGIVVYSKTGNTFSVAQRIKNALLKIEREVSLEQVTVRNEHENIKKMQLKDKPEVRDYEMLILGAPVWGFSLSTVMDAYLAQVGPLQGKKVICFVTHAFPYSWLGGNRAIGQMKKLCAAMGADVVETGIIDWSNKQREAQITRLVEIVGGLF